MTDTTAPRGRGTRLYDALARFILAALVAQEAGAIAPVVADGTPGPFETFTFTDFDERLDAPQAAPHIKAVIDARNALGDTLDDVDATLDAFDEVTHMLPGNLEEALRTQHACVIVYEDWTRSYLAALGRWRAADVESARIRRQCVEDLRVGGPDRVALAPSNAEKEASNHPTYTAHRDRCATLADEKDAAEASMKVAKARADAASDYVQALMQMADAERERLAIEATREERARRGLAPHAGAEHARLRSVLYALYNAVAGTAAGVWPTIHPALEEAYRVLAAAGYNTRPTPRRRKDAVDEESLNAEAMGEPEPVRTAAREHGGR